MTVEALTLTPPSWPHPAEEGRAQPVLFLFLDPAVALDLSWCSLCYLMLRDVNTHWSITVLLRYWCVCVRVRVLFFFQGFLSWSGC